MDCKVRGVCAIIHMRKYIPAKGIGGYNVQKKTLSAIVAVLIAAVCIGVGLYVKNHRGGHTSATVVYDLSGQPGSLPEGWYVNSYENEYQAYGDETGTITLFSNIADDLRLCKKVTVEESARYVLTGEIATVAVAEGRGASLSIDNYSLDKSCVYSEGLTGDNGFTETRLYFETKPGQTEVILALRLGGYSEASSGLAQFRNISLRPGSAEEGHYQLLEAWGGFDEEDNDAAFRDEEQYKSFFAVIVWAAVLAGVAEGLGRRFLESQRGTVHSVLFETKKNGLYYGHTGNYIYVKCAADEDLKNQIRDVVLGNMAGDAAEAFLAEKH